MWTKHLILSLLGVAYISEASAKQATKDHLSIALEAGVSIASKPLKDSTEYHDKTFKAAIPVSIGIGYNFTEQFKAGISISHRSHKFDQTYIQQNPQSGEAKYQLEQKLRNTTLMLGGQYDVTDFNGISPYVSLGIGATYAATSDFDRSEKIGDNTIIYKKLGNDKLQFAWNIGVGAEMQVAESVVVGIGYKFTSFGKMKTSELDEVWGATGSADPIRLSVKQVVGDSRAISTNLNAHEILAGIRYYF